ncbi:MAG: hypothetical protein HY706_02400 [Candidatus Hydrogenedentes bacterium]|nr:hypothetical protein [Candidatus Hydrogenedentota bacterium]
MSPIRNLQFQIHNRLELPLVNLELTRLAKQPRTYLVRLLVIGGMLIVLLIMLGFGGLTTTNVTAAGETMARCATLFQFLVVFLYIPILTGPMIATEKQENTLALLLLADFRGRHVFLAKFLAAFLQAELLVLSTLPMLAFATFLGGVSMEDVAFRTATFSLFAATACTLGLACSTVARSPRNAQLRALLASSIWILVPFLFDVYFDSSGVLEINTSPLCILFGSPGDYGMVSWLIILLTAMLLFVFCTVRTIVLLPRFAYGNPVDVERRAPSRRVSEWDLFSAVPIEKLFLVTSLGYRSFRPPVVRNLFIGGLMAVVASALSVAGWPVLMAFLSYTIARSVVWLRQQPLFEDLLLSRVEDRHLGKAYLDLFLSHIRVYALPLIPCGVILQWNVWRISSSYRGTMHDDRLFWFFLMTFALLLAHLFVTVVVGGYFALQDRTRFAGLRVSLLSSFLLLLLWFGPAVLLEWHLDWVSLYNLALTQPDRAHAIVRWTYIGSFAVAMLLFTVPAIFLTRAGHRDLKANFRLLATGGTSRTFERLTGIVAKASPGARNRGG